MSDLRLSEIWIYPIKSLGGIRLSTARVLEKGFVHDRRWMLIDENNRFMTQRAIPQMALFQVSLSGDTVTVTKKYASSADASIQFSTQIPNGSSIRTNIWEDQVDTLEIDPQFSQWFSRHLGMACRLVCFPEENPRLVDPKYRLDQENVSLADAYPFLIIGQRSLDDLNARLKEPVPMNRFRPNLVFTGGAPFEEDTWRNIRIGKNNFVVVKPCARCVLTTVNQDTAEKGIEPLATLSGYRRIENKVLFGQNVIAIDHTEVSVGDPIVLC